MHADFSVLIVEDDDDARRNMEDILSLDGYQIKSVSHCLPAINAVQREKFDAVIVDWRLPDENADQLIPVIVEGQPNTPVVVVTGIRDFETAVSALRSGAYDFLLKPINPDVLRSLLRRIVERRKHLSELETAHQQLLVNERLAAIGQMVAGLAHESRNAFQRSHACLAELALDLESQPECLQLVNKVQKALDDIHMLLEEVRNYAAPIVLERRQCEMESLTRETWQQILDARHLTTPPTFMVSVDSDFPDRCFLDCDRIRQVMRNLLENAAFAAGDDGTVEVKIKFADPTHSRIRIEVTDSGSGIEDTKLEEIFTSFFTTKTKGTGLGLAVSRRMVEAHDGRIFAKNNGDTEQGATFVIELPRS